MNCKKCGRTIDKSAKYCNYCGTKLGNTALIIGICLASVGIILTGAILASKGIIFKQKEKTNEPVKVLSRLERKAEDKSSTWKRYDASEKGKGTPAENFILLDDFINLDGRLVLRYKNLNDKYTEINFSVDYLDADGNLIKNETSNYAQCMSLSDCIFTIMAPTKKSSYNSYKINLEVELMDFQYKADDYYKEFTIKGTDDGKNIIAKVTNIGEKSSYPRICVAYFLGDELKDAECVSEDVNSGDTVTVKFYNYYFNKKYKGFNFDNYKVFINN